MTLLAVRCENLNARKLTKQAPESIPSPGVSTGAFDLLGGGHYQGSNDTFLSPGLAMQSDYDAMPMPMDPLEALFDTPAKFDWVCDIRIQSLWPIKLMT